MRSVPGRPAGASGVSPLRPETLNIFALEAFSLQPLKHFLLLEHFLLPCLEHFLLMEHFLLSCLEHFLFMKHFLLPRLEHFSSPPNQIPHVEHFLLLEHPNAAESRPTRWPGPRGCTKDSGRGPVSGRRRKNPSGVCWAPRDGAHHNKTCLCETMP